MTLPYQNCRSGAKALDEIKKILKAFGCNKFASGNDWETGEVFVQFEYKGYPVSMKASARGYAAAYLLENTWRSTRTYSKTEWEQRALDKGSVAVYSILRDWVKGQVTAIETGILTFEAAFLSHILLPTGKRVIEEMEDRQYLPLKDAKLLERGE